METILELSEFQFCLLHSNIGALRTGSGLPQTQQNYLNINATGKYNSLNFKFFFKCIMVLITIIAYYLGVLSYP